MFLRSIGECGERCFWKCGTRFLKMGNAVFEKRWTALRASVLWCVLVLHTFFMHLKNVFYAPEKSFWGLLKKFLTSVGESEKRPPKKFLRPLKNVFEAHQKSFWGPLWTFIRRTCDVSERGQDFPNNTAPGLHHPPGGPSGTQQGHAACKGSSTWRGQPKKATFLTNF